MGICLLEYFGGNPRYGNAQKPTYRRCQQSSDVTRQDAVGSGMNTEKKGMNLPQRAHIQLAFAVLSHTYLFSTFVPSLIPSEGACTAHNGSE